MNKINVWKDGEQVSRKWDGLPTEDLENWTLDHVSGGPWVMVENLDYEYCRVAGLDMVSGDVGDQAFLAWKPRLKRCTTKIGGPIPEHAKAKLEQLREEIRIGRIVIENTRFVTTKP